MTDRRLALVVAVDRHDHPKLQQLAAPAAAEALAGVLGDADLGGFEVDVVHNAASWTIAQRVERMLADGRPTDLEVRSARQPVRCAQPASPDPGGDARA